MKDNLKQNKTNEKLNRFLLAGDQFMSEMHLRQPGITYSAFRPFTKTQGRMQTFRRIVDLTQIYQKELDKSFFQVNIAHDYFKNLPRETAFDKLLCNLAFDTAKNLKDDGCQKDLASMVYKSFDRKNVRWCSN